MKSELDEITFYYLFLDSVVFSDGRLTISLSQGAVSIEKEDVTIVEDIKIKGSRRIDVFDASLGFEVVFDDAVFYQVIGESANNFIKDEIEHDGNIMTFKSSALVDYLKNDTLLFQVTAQDEKIAHYCVKTADDWIHVLAREAPTVARRKT
jgi:hypothetical protein